MSNSHTLSIPGSMFRRYSSSRASQLERLDASSEPGDARDISDSLPSGSASPLTPSPFDALPGPARACLRCCRVMVEDEQKANGAAIGVR
jgi:hypothetical protein